MFGDFFQKVGNFFTGSGFVNDDEERRKKAEEARRKAEQARQAARQQVERPQVQQQPRVSAPQPKNPFGFNFNAKPERPVTLNDYTKTDKVKPNNVQPQPTVRDAAAYNEIQQLFNQRKNAAINREKEQVPLLQRFTTDTGWQRRAERSAWNSALTDYYQKHGYKDTPQSIKNIQGIVNTGANKAVEDSKKAIENTNTAVNVARFLPGAGIGELTANVFRGNLSGSKEADDRLLREQMGLNDAQIKSLSDDDRKKYLLVSKGGLASGLLDFFGLGAGGVARQLSKETVETAARSSAKQVAKDVFSKQGAKAAAKSAAAGGVAGGAIGYGGSKLLGADDETAQRNAINGLLLGMIGGVASRPVDAAIARVAGGKTVQEQRLLARELLESDAADNIDGSTKNALRDIVNEEEVQASRNIDAVRPEEVPTVNRPKATEEQLTSNYQNDTGNINRALSEGKITQEQASQQLEARRQQFVQELSDLRASLQEGADTSTQAVKQATDETQATQQAQEQAVQAAQEQRQAAETPAPQDIVQAPEQPADAELAANRPTIDELLYSDNPQFQEREGLSLGQRLSPDRFIRERITNPIEQLFNKAGSKMQTSSSATLRGGGRLGTGFSREFGRTNDIQDAARKLRGGIETGKLNRENIANLGNGFSEDSRNRIFATFDKERAGQLGLDGSNLTPEEHAVRVKLKAIIDDTTNMLYSRGLINKEQASVEEYIKRDYHDLYGEDGKNVTKFENGFRTELLKQTKGRKEVSDEKVKQAITDPFYLVAKKRAEAEALSAMHDYGTFLARSGRTSDVELPGYTKLPEAQILGEASGKYVPRNLAEDFTGFQYNNAMVSAFNDLVTAYDRLGIRQAKKQLLTIFNPAVRLGNQVTNRGIFANLAGINPIQFNLIYSQVGKQINQNSQLYREAVAQGLTGIDITQADFYAKRMADVTGDADIAKKAVKWVQDSYSGADDKARITAYIINRQRGYSQEDAARMVQRGFQDYKSVGFFYDLAAKTPFIGNAFVRFASDSIRVAKNAAIDHPLRSMATVALWSAFTGLMSDISGESEEDRQTRENRFGAPKLPFTDISLNVQTPWGEVNVARFMPWYNLNEIGDSEVSKFLPVQESPITFEDGKVKLNPAGFQDPLLGQGVQIVMDRDFRDKSIQDPNNTDNKYQLDPLSDEEKRNNLLRFLFTQNAPLGKEIDQTIAAAQGQKDIYGKDRNLLQAIGRDFGLKVEQYGKEQAADQRATEKYFEDLDAINKELDGMTPSEQEAWKRLTGFYKLRDQVDNSFEPGATRDKKAPVYGFSEDKWKDYASNPKLYDLMVKKKQMANERDGTPIQPEFDTRLPADFRKQLLQNKMVAPGDDAELDQRMYSSPQWDYYMQLKEQYSKDAAKYYPKSDNENFTDELVKHQDSQFPKKPDVYAAYTAQYGAYANGQGAKPEFTNAVKAAREQYEKDTFKWTNKERLARGLPPIPFDMWTNPTFGYDSSKSGKGYGFGGGGGDYEDTYNVLNPILRLARAERLAAPTATEQQVKLALQQFLARGAGGRRSSASLGASATGNPRQD